jgi:hypothetical protein
LVAERDDGIDHAECDTAEDELQKDFHDFTQWMARPPPVNKKMARLESSRLATLRQEAKLTWPVLRGRL